MVALKLLVMYHLTITFLSLRTVGPVSPRSLAAWAIARFDPGCSLAICIDKQRQCTLRFSGVHIRADADSLGRHGIEVILAECPYAVV